MEQLIQVLIQQNKKGLKLSKKQNQLIEELICLLAPTDKEKLKSMIVDNTELKAIFNVADTKFYRMKKLFPTYELDAKDYYLSDEILATIKKHKRSEEENEIS